MKALALILAALLAPATVPVEHVNHTVLKKLKWQFVFPTDTAGAMSLIDAGAVAKTLTAHHLEVVLGQRIAADSDDTLNAQLDDSHATALLAKLKASGLDIVTLRADGMPSADELPAVLHLAKMLGAKVVVLPAGDAVAAKAADSEKLSLAITTRLARDGRSIPNMGLVTVAGDPATTLASVMEARMTADRTADAEMIKQLLARGFKGAVSVQPAEKTQASTVAAMDAFADALNDVPTTQP